MARPAQPKAGAPRRQPHVLGALGRRRLAWLQRQPLLLAFDFDGTLAPIVDRPDDARVLPALVPLLVRASARWPVAVVTGRALADLRDRLGFVPQHLVGSHGAEGLALADADAAAAVAALDAWRARLRDAAPQLLAAGVELEDKGASLALHYRRAADPTQARRVLEAVLAQAPPCGAPVRRFGGKCVENLVAAAAPDKGDAVHHLARLTGARAVLFVGDDVTDESVFRRALPDWLTVRVGRDPLGSAAAFHLNSVEQMPLLVQGLLESE